MLTILQLAIVLSSAQSRQKRMYGAPKLSRPTTQQFYNKYLSYHNNFGILLCMRLSCMQMYSDRCYRLGCEAWPIVRNGDASKKSVCGNMYSSI